MIKNLLFIVFASASFIGNAQNTNFQFIGNNGEKLNAISYNTVAEKPIFHGVDNANNNYKALHSYLQSFNNYYKNGDITIPVYFIINTKGECKVIKILYPESDPLTEIARKIIEEMPIWKAGKNNGKPVNVSYNLNLVF
jgi:hypothetical protein